LLITGGEVGLLLTLASSITQTLNWFVRSSTALESQMNNVERIFHYTRTVPEAPLEIPETKPRHDWPQHGAIELRNVSMKYRVDLKPVINNVSCTIQPREKIGVVGRTGAGKSSLTNILFRLVEPCNGEIIIDGVDVSKIGLRTLRSALAIIPQVMLIDPLHLVSIKFSD
jgi:ATP-binding cassette subfamily C (CFTR/MRP) protein 1